VRLPSVGEDLPPLRIAAVDPERMKTMALLLRDPNDIHFDVESVRALGMGDRTVNQGPINLGYAVRMVADWAGGEDRIRSFESRFLSNVFAGDTVVAAGRVVEVADRRVTCEVWLDIEGGRRALQGTAIVDL
jgi:acyl dehydratase